MLAGGWGSGDMERNISEEGVRAPLPSPDGWRGGEGRRVEGRRVEGRRVEERVEGRVEGRGEEGV